MDHSSALLEIETKLYDLKQGSMGVNDYYNSGNNFGKILKSQLISSAATLLKLTLLPVTLNLLINILGF